MNIWIENSVICMFFVRFYTKFIKAFKQSNLYKICMTIGGTLGMWIEGSYLVRKYNQNYKADNIYKDSLLISIIEKFMGILNKPIKGIRECILDSNFYKICKSVKKQLEDSIICKSLKQFLNRSGVISILMIYPFIDFFIREFNQGLIASIWDESLFLAALIVFLISSILDGKLRIRFTRIDLPLIAFIMFSIFLVMINSPDFGIAIEGLRVQIEYMFWYFLVINLIKKEEHIKSILKTFVWTNFFVALYGIYQYLIGVETPKSWIVASQENITTRVFSVVKSCNLLGSILVLSIPIAISMIYTANTKIKKMLYIACTIVMVACIALTYSRGAWIALVAAIFIFAVLKDKKILTICLGGALVVPIVMPSLVSRLLYMFTNDYAQKSAKAGRIERWGTAIQYGMQHPFKGLGIGRFGGATASIHNMPNTFYTDNYYVKTFAENGIIGLAIFLILLFFVIKMGFGIIKLCKGNNYFESISIGIYAGLIGVITNNLVENVFENAIMTTYFWSLLGILFAIKYLMLYKPSSYNLIDAEDQDKVVLYDEL